MKLCPYCEGTQVYSKYRDGGSVLYCKTCLMEWKNPDYPFKKRMKMKAVLEIDAETIKTIIAQYLKDKDVKKVDFKTRKVYEDRPGSNYYEEVLDKAVVTIEI